MTKNMSYARENVKMNKKKKTSIETCPNGERELTLRSLFFVKKNLIFYLKFIDCNYMFFL